MARMPCEFIMGYLRIWCMAFIMYITLEADYGVRIMVLLAQKNDRTGAQNIADNTGVPRRFALKILNKLIKGGLLSSYVGKNGGYVLARPANKITLCDIIETIEGEYVFSRCLQGGHECGYDTSEINCNDADCKVRCIYSDISKTVRGKLSGVTLADL